MNHKERPCKGEENLSQGQNYTLAKSYYTAPSASTQAFVAERIARALGGRWHGAYGTACCPAHEDRRPSLSLRDGDDGRLLVRCFAGCAFGDILAALRGLGLVDGRGEWRPPDPARTARRQTVEAEAAQRRRRQAAECWRESGRVAGTLGEAYLRRRGITCSPPRTLRFHPEAWHMSARRLPALVACLQHADSSGAGVQRVYLAAPGRKADVDPVKATLGPVRGAAVHLADGPGALVVAEGLETALALVGALAARRVSVWATCGTSGMAALALPPSPGFLTIAPDGDPAGARAAEALRRRATAAGWQVRLMDPPGPGRDWADEVAA